jgi:putative ABC transport system substrate-binding protein
MKRRQFITLLGGAAAWPLAAHGQQAKLRTIGFIGASASAAVSAWVSAFVQRLRFVRRGVNIIVAEGTVTTLAAKKATATIPIIFPIAGDPVGNKLVDSLARPGGNVTGLSIQATDLASKRLELFREIVPGLTRLAIMANVSSPNSALEIGELRSTAPVLGIDAGVFEIRRAEDIAPAFEALKGNVQALYVPPDPLVFSNRTAINTLALGQRLPTMYAYRDYVQSAGLASYGPNLPDLFRRAADFVDKIFRGAKPADIPVEQPTKFDFVVNLKTAKALGLDIPPMLLARADEVIE